MSEKEKGQSEASGNDESSAPSSSASAYGDLGFIDAGLGERAAEAEAGAAAVVTDIHAKRNATDAKRAELRAAYPDIRQRAHAMSKTVPPDFREVKIQNSGGQVVQLPLLTDANIMDVFACLFGKAGEAGRPHFDTFRGLTVGWNGSVIDDDYDLTPLVDALIAFRLQAPTFERVEKLFKRFARQVRINSLTERMNGMIPEWDGTPRAERQLIKLFEPLDTAMNREFGLYFWLSIYCRAMHPGCNASMVLALFGPMGVGKSYMGKLICEEMMGDSGADTVTLDWSSDFNDFLRKITGQSVVANVAEMAGFGRAEMTKIKNLTTRTMDVMNYKFERDNQQLRQWVMVMDGNEYKGLQRDEQGNRRFYPMFVGQLPFDSRGQVQWKEDFYVDFDGFRSDFWQVMAECREWMRVHGLNGYNKFITALEKKVRAFNDVEMRNDRGTVRDDDLEAFIVPALRACGMFLVEPHVYRTEDGKGVGGRPIEKTGAVVTAADIRIALSNVSNRTIKLIPTHMKTKLTSMGAECALVGNQRVYLWKEINSLKEWEAMLAALDAGGMRRAKEPAARDNGEGGF